MHEVVALGKQETCCCEQCFCNSRTFLVPGVHPTMHILPVPHSSPSLSTTRSSLYTSGRFQSCLYLCSLQCTNCGICFLVLSVQTHWNVVAKLHIIVRNACSTSYRQLYYMLHCLACLSLVELKNRNMLLFPTSPAAIHLLPFLNPITEPFHFKQELFRLD